jgi:hypothetical protein
MLFLSLLGSPSFAQQFDIELVWVDNASNEDGFSIERKLGPTGAFASLAAVGPNAEAYADTSVISGVTYCYRVKAFNAAGESEYTNEACGMPSVATSTTGSVQTASTAASPGGGGGGGCFIATAAFGSPGAPEVQVLRDLRDRYLLAHPLGRWAVAGYYWVSPPLADGIRASDPLRALTRGLLWPVVGWAALTLAAPAAGGGLALLPVVGGLWWLGRRRRAAR